MQTRINNLFIALARSLSVECNHITDTTLKQRNALDLSAKSVALCFLVCFWLCLPLGAQAQLPSAASASARSTSSSRTTSSTYLIDDTTQRFATDTSHQGVVFTNKEESDSALSALTFIFHYQPLATRIFTIAHPKIDPTGKAVSDIIDLPDQFYLSRGLGQVHSSLFWRPSSTHIYKPSGFERYLSTPTTVKLYQTRRPYTELSYSSSLHKDYRLHFTHSQNITSRWNVAADAGIIKRDGVYTQSAVKDRDVSITTNYYSLDARYQLQAGFTNHHNEQDENGGVADDSTWWQQSSRSGVPVRMYAAANRYRSTTLFAHQTFNTTRPYEQAVRIAALKHHTDTTTLAADSLPHRDTSAMEVLTYKPATPHKVLNSGVFGLDIRLDRQKRNFYDNDFSHGLYDNIYIDSTKSLDSTTIYNLEGLIYWTNDAFSSSQWKNPLTLTVGLRPQLSSLPSWDWAAQSATGSNTLAERRLSDVYISPLAQLKLRLNRFLLQLDGEYAVGGFRNGDLRESISLRYGGRGSEVALSFLHQASAPDYFYHEYASNNYRWHVDDYRKTTVEQLAATYSHSSARSDSSSFRFDIDLSASLSRLADLVCINELSLPQQFSEATTLLQARLFAQLHAGWFHLSTLQLVQHSTATAVLDVPLWATKNSIYADVMLFRNALRLQTGVNLRYHTRYYADAWNASLGTFSHQRATQVGNYVWADLFVSLQIKRATIYLQASHLNALLETSSPNYFTLPHYPGEDFGLYWGVIWKFFD